MYWFVTDETNLEPSQGTFFIYGGLVMTPEQMNEAHNVVDQIRTKYGYKGSDSFKFQTSSRPQHLSVETWTASKAEAIEAAARLGIDLIVYIVHHGIAAKQAADKRMEYALNSVLMHFDGKYLAEKQDVGVVCVDRLDPKFGYGYLRSIFQEPLELASGFSPRLSRIIHYSMSCDGASHMSSLVDIVLGGFRFCANAAMGKGSDEIAKTLFPSISRLMWSKELDGLLQIGGYGFLQYPKVIKAASYQNHEQNTVGGDAGGRAKPLRERYARTRPRHRAVGHLPGLPRGRRLDRQRPGRDR
jgi:hypothetical protein